MTSLSRQFADGLVNKTYVAVVALDPNHASTALRDGTQNHSNTTTTPSLFSSSSWQLIDYPIDGKPSQTEWCVVKYQPPYALLQIRPHQGRTHQIRRHLAYNLNSPIIGDTKYTSKQQTQLLLRNEGNQHVHDDDGMMYLCCYELEFQHPSSTRRSLLTETTTPESFSKHSGAESAQSLPDGAAVIKSDCETGRLMKIHMPIPDAFWNKLSVRTKIVDPDGDKTTWSLHIQLDWIVKLKITGIVFHNSIPIHLFSYWISGRTESNFVSFCKHCKMPSSRFEIRLKSVLLYHFDCSPMLRNYVWSLAKTKSHTTTITP